MGFGIAEVVDPQSPLLAGIPAEIRDLVCIHLFS